MDMYDLNIPREMNPERVLKKRFRRILCVSSISQKVVVRRDVCSYCGGKGGTVDHIKPQANGGHATPTNVTGACVKCNSKKSNKSLLRFLLEAHNERRRQVSSGASLVSLVD